MVSAAENPFRVERIHALPYHAPGFHWDNLLAQLEAMNYCAAITGPHGHGKTTLMIELADHLRVRGWTPKYLFLNRDKPSFSRRALQSFLRELGPEDVVLFDGAEQLGFMAWWRFQRRTRHARGLIITGHRPNRLPTVHKCYTSPEILDALLNVLVPAKADIFRDEAHRLFQENSGDLRQVWFGLYDHCAGRGLSRDPASSLPGSAIIPASR